MGDALGVLPGWAWALVVLVVLVAWYLTYTAARLDRMHTRVEGALSALDGQLVRRAETVLAIGSCALLDPAGSFALTTQATACLDAAPFAGDTLDEAAVIGPGSRERAQLENELSETLREVLDPASQERLRLDDEGADLLDRLAAVGLRVQLSRGFHDQAVADALALRRNPAARLFHLAGHAAAPARVPLDDRLPEGLSAGRTMER